jgi:glycosidase
MTTLYAKLIDLKQENPALWNGNAGGEIQFLQTSEPEKLLAFAREKENNSVLVLMNLSATPLNGTVQTTGAKTFTNWFTGENTEVSATNQVELAPWEYKILVSK